VSRADRFVACRLFPFLRCFLPAIPGGFLRNETAADRASLAASLSECSGLRIANAQRLNEMSPQAERYDVKSDVVTGFPTSSACFVMGDLLAGFDS